MATKSAAVSSYFVKGKNVFIRTATNYLVGEVVSVDAQEIILKDAAWVAHTGRFADAMRTGVFSEVEPFCAPVMISRGAIIDATTYAGALPLAQL